MNEPQSSPVAGMPPQTNTKKPVWKRWWFGVIIVVVFLAIAGIGSGATNGTAGQPQSQQQASASSEPSDSAESSSPEPDPDVPVEYTNALKSAENYSDLMHMSQQGIYNQLTSEFDQFSAEAAQYAIDNLQADYKANALAAAKNYQDTMAMSPEAIRDQLVSEYGNKFTQEEADYAIAHLND